MKKALCILLAAVMLFSLCPFAFAEEGGSLERPVLPDGHPEDHIPYLSALGIGNPDLPVKNAGSLSVFVRETKRTSAPTITWQAYATGGSGSYQFQFMLLGLFDPPYTIVHVSGDFADSDTYRYTFHVSGEYTLIAIARDTATGQQASAFLDLSLASSSKLPSIQALAASLVEECVAAGCKTDYEKALWLHDWLTQNANYDHTYSHYGPDGVLCCGTGVCDSYSKAYYYLLQAAGIPVERVVNSNHAWNVIRLEKKWYYVDVTWDDPGEGGYENHQYFCLPDEILSMDHSGYSCPYTCDSYDCNYFAKSGDGAKWADTLAANVQNGLQAGSCAYTALLPEHYDMEGWWYSNRPSQWSLLGDNVTLMLAGKRSYSYGREKLPLTIFKAKDSDPFAWVFLNAAGRTLTLPKKLTRIGEGAFENDSRLLAVTIPSGVTAIESSAFANCGSLWSVRVPATVKTIGSLAFDRANSHLTLIVDAGSQAEQFAMRNGIRYLHPADIPASTETERSEDTWAFG